jgi:hypothetical protein
MWQGVDAEIISGLSATTGKYIFTRVRPINLRTAVDRA